jgi:centractin
VGEQLNSERKGLLKMKYPMNHGIIENWDDMELLWKHAYELLKASPKEYPVLLTEPNLNPLSHKLKLIEIFFNKYGVPALFVAGQGVLSLYGSGKTTGVVLDSGDGVTHVVPVYEGYSIPHACERIDLGGRDVTTHLMQLLRKNGANFHTSVSG